MDELVKRNGRCYCCGFSCIPIIHNHHLIPQKYDGEMSETIHVCPNCHAIIHKALSRVGNEKYAELLGNWINENLKQERIEKLVEVIEIGRKAIK